MRARIITPARAALLPGAFEDADVGAAGAAGALGDEGAAGAGHQASAQHPGAQRVAVAGVDDAEVVERAAHPALASVDLPAAGRVRAPPVVGAAVEQPQRRGEAPRPAVQPAYLLF